MLNILRSAWEEVAPPPNPNERSFDGLHVPFGLHLGSPFRTMGTGPCVSPHTGRPLDVEVPITKGDLEEMARVFHTQRELTPVIIDWSHGSALAATSPVEGKSFGRVVDVWVADLDDGRGPGLYILPAYTAEGAHLVESQSGTLWSSPEFVVGDVYSRVEEGVKIGTAQLFAVALTGRPGQATGTIDPVFFSEAARGAKKMIDAVKQEAVEQPPPAVDPPEPVVEEPVAAPGLEDLLRENAALKARLAEAPPEEAMRTLRTEAASAVSLRAEVTTLRAEVAKIRGEIAAVEEARVLDVMIARGLIVKGELEEARSAYALRGTHPIHWQRFAGRTQPVVHTEAGGHAFPAPVTTRTDKEARVRAYCAANNLDYRTDYVKALRAVEAAL